MLFVNERLIVGAVICDFCVSGVGDFVAPDRYKKSINLLNILLTM